MGHADNHVIAKLVRLECSGRYIYVPGDKVKFEPRDARAKVHEVGNEVTITSCRYDSPALIHGTFIVLLTAIISILYSLYTWIPIDDRVGLTIATIILVVFFVAGVAGYVSAVFSIQNSEGLLIDGEQISFASTCLIKLPEPVAISRIKAIGIDDPNVGAEPDSAYAGWGYHVNLVFLDHRRVRLIGIPIYTLEEAEWLAGFILERFPQMFDAGVLPQAGKNQVGMPLHLVSRPVFLHCSEQSRRGRSGR